MTPRHRRRLGVFVGIALLVPLAAQLAASGDPIDDKRAEASHIQDQLDAQGRKVSIAAEQFNRAQANLGDVRDALAKAQSDLKRSDDRLGVIKGQLAQVAVMAYVHGGSNATLSRLVRSTDEDNLLARTQYLQMAANDQRALIGQLRAAKEDFTALKVKLTADEKSAQAATDAAAAARRDAVAAEDAQRAILGRVQGELSTLVAAEEQRRLAAEAAKAPAPIAATAVAPALAFDDVPAKKAAPAAALQVASKAPSLSSGAARAVEVAEAQVGKPYVYGGSGPDSFDCSGLTSYAWRAAGVSLSHDAYRQWFETSRVSLDDIQPGDLLFFGDDGVESIHHVAMYVGGGQMVEASQTGIPVRYRGWRASDLVGAGRPG